MTRRTSAETYRQIKSEGLLSTRRFQVYEELYHHGPMTATECLDSMHRQGISISSQSHTRFSELRDLGVVYEVRERACTQTGRSVIEWDVTEKLPTGKVKKGSKGLSKKTLRRGLEDMRRLARMGRDSGYKLSPEFIELGKWIARIAEK